MHLTEDVYKPLGLTTLYVPKENIEMFSKPSSKIASFLLVENKRTLLSEDAEEKRKLVGRLENVVWCWIKQMDKAVRTNVTEGKIKSIQNEVTYWNVKR